MAIEDIRKMMAVGIPAEAAKVVDEVVTASGASIAWDDVTGKPATFAPTIGTTSTTAKAGDYAPAWGDVTGKPTTFPATVPVSTATALATGRTITVNFAAAAAVPTFDGTANVVASLAHGAAVADAAGANPTKAEFDALLASLRTAGVIAT